MIEIDHVIVDEYGNALDIENFDRMHTYDGRVATIYWDHDGIILKDNLRGMEKYADSETIIITKEVFDAVKEIRSDFFAKLYNAYWRVPQGQIPLLPEVNPTSNVELYTEEYYPTIDTDLLDMDPEYFCESLKGIDKLIKIFSDRGIIVDDFSAKNVLFTPNGIVVIDADCYRIDREIDPSIIYTYNKARFDEMILSILMRIRHECKDMEKANFIDYIVQRLAFAQKSLTRIWDSTDTPADFAIRNLIKNPDAKTLYKSMKR